MTGARFSRPAWKNRWCGYVQRQARAGFAVALALNDGVMSEWATTDASGKYAIGVPYGKYRIDGYELDYTVVHALLGGKDRLAEQPPVSFGRDHRGRGRKGLVAGWISNMSIR